MSTPDEQFEFIPEKIRNFIKNLNDKDADVIWEYLDSDPNASIDLVDYLCETHKELVKRITTFLNMKEKEI